MKSGVSSALFFLCLSTLATPTIAAGTTAAYCVGPVQITALGTMKNPSLGPGTGQKLLVIQVVDSGGTKSQFTTWGFSDLESGHVKAMASIAQTAFSLGQNVYIGTEDGFCTSHSGTSGTAVAPWTSNSWIWDWSDIVVVPSF
jgi:hypothetical protein